MSAGNVTNSSQGGFLQRNWFKIGIAVLLLFLLFKKDLTFSINMRAPAKQQQDAPTHRAKKEKNTELMTESKTTAARSEPDRFDVSLFGSKTKPPKAIEQLAKLDDALVQAYLRRFARVAASERTKFGIPASVILANAALQSYAGQRDIASQSNNHFALPCTSDWQGSTAEINSKCFRKYDNAWTSFRDNSFYMTTGKMSVLKDLKNADYKAWAKALEKADYSDEPDFAAQLINVIEKYGLTKLDD